MAWTNWGFDGTINEAQWAQMAGLLGNGYVAAGNGDCLVTAVGGARSVSVAAGTLYGDGVVSVNSAPETVAMTTPVNGQWYVIALRRTWATNTAALVAIAGATTTTTTPTAPPTSFPTLNTNVGVLTDQPIAWAWCNSANTTVVVYDIRLKAVKSLPPVVANGTERDAKFMTPTQGLQVWRDDIGAVETYYGLYNASTNPGGRDTAGWYTNDRQTGLVPMKPTSVTAVTGTATTNSLGKVSFSGVTKVILGGIFTSQYNNYIMECVFYPSIADTTIGGRLTASGAESSTNSYTFAGLYSSSTGTTTPHQGLQNNSYFELLGNSGVADRGNFIKAQFIDPAKAVNTKLVQQGWSAFGVGFAFWVNGQHAVQTAYDGLSIIPTQGNITGEITIYGVN